MWSVPSFFGPKITLEQLSHLFGNLATCISAGLDIPTSLNTCQRSSPSPLLKEILTDAAKQTAAGMKLFDALELHKSRFPTFVLPAVRCGEESGHLDQTLRYLESHCRLLIGPTRTMRDMWLVPLCLMLGGTVICTLAYCFLAPWQMTVQYIVDSLEFYASIAIAVAAVFWIRPLRALVETVRLAVPVIGPAERELTLNRFFHAMNLLYSTGGRRVEQMIRLAADAAGNPVLRSDFLRAAESIESGNTISEAFSVVENLPLDYKATIVAGDESGTLEAAFDSVCQQSGESVVSRLAAFQPVYFRIVSLAVMGSVIATFYSLSFLRR
jgi:type II secretory pathway component PulF